MKWNVVLAFVFISVSVCISRSHAQLSWHRILPSQVSDSQFFYGACASLDENDFSVIGSVDHIGDFSNEANTYLFKRTTDGGETWTKNDLGLPKFGDAPRGPEFTLISIVDSTHIFIASDSCLFSSSSDAGRTWSPVQQLDSFVISLQGISFFDTLHGIIVDLAGRLFLTSDGGKTWRHTQPLLFDVFGSCKAFSSGQYIVADVFRDKVFISKDFGQTWDTIYAYKPPDSSFDARSFNLYFKDTLNGFLLGSYFRGPKISFPLIVKTSDGGNNWSIIVDSSSDKVQYLNSLCFLDDKRGVALGRGSHALMTTDGGNTWYEDTINVPTDYSDISQVIKLSSNKVMAIFEDGNTAGNVYIGEWNADEVSEKQIPCIHQIFSILSNPVASSASFQFGALKSQTPFELFDALGRLLLRKELVAGQSSLHLDIQQFPAGIYFARLEGEMLRFVKL